MVLSYQIQYLIDFVAFSLVFNLKNCLRLFLLQILNTMILKKSQKTVMKKIFYVDFV